MDEVDAGIGRRVREIRTWRGLSLTVTAELAGLSPGYLSRIERGQRPVQRRATLEALASALRVAPAELSGQAHMPIVERDAVGQAAVEDLRGVLRDIDLEVVPDILGLDPQRVDLAQLSAEVEYATGVREACDYGRLGEVVPTLIARAHLATETSASAREFAIRALMLGFRLAKDLGYPDVGWIAAQQLHRHVEALGDDAWCGVGNFVRAEALAGSGARLRAGALVRGTADELTIADPRAAQAYGLLHLSAALQAAVTGDGDVSAHLDEASDTATRTGEGNFAQQHFGPRNVGVWRVALAVEVGEVGRVPELARAVDVEAIPVGRRASLYCDLGRGLAARRGREAEAIEALGRAEVLAPETTRANPYVRETVTDLLVRARRNAGGRDLRGLAYRMGVAG